MPSKTCQEPDVFASLPINLRTSEVFLHPNVVVVVVVAEPSH